MSNVSFINFRKFCRKCARKEKKTKYFLCKCESLPIPKYIISSIFRRFYCFRVIYFYFKNIHTTIAKQTEKRRTLTRSFLIVNNKENENESKFCGVDLYFVNKKQNSMFMVYIFMMILTFFVTRSALLMLLFAVSFFRKYFDFDTILANVKTICF